MKKIIIPALLILVSCSGNKSEVRSSFMQTEQEQPFNQEEATGEVWICTGKSSHAYHTNPDCYGINACKASKKKITLQEAIDMGRTPCHYCHEQVIAEPEQPKDNG